MIANESNLKDIEERLERIEEQLFQKRALALQTLALVDENENIRAVLTVHANDSTLFDMIDETGKWRLRLSLLENRLPAISITDSQHRLRVILSLDPSESPYITFLDEDGNIILQTPSPFSS